MRNLDQISYKFHGNFLHFHVNSGLFSVYVQWNSDNSTSDTSKICLTQTKFHGPCLGNDNFWAYLELLVITRTDKLRLVPPNYLFCGWICLHSCVTSLTSLLSFSHEKKISELSKSLARKWNTLERNRLATVVTWLMQRESITYNSNLS